MEHSNLVTGDGNRIDQSRTINNYYGLPETKPAPTRNDRNEKTLIDAVWTEVDDRLRQSLHNAILIRLDMAEQRSQVSRPWDSELRTADQSAKTLPPNTPIAEVFDRRDVGGKLLILGNPGAGKTTTMLDLAATLVQRANDDPSEPMPVMVNLSSWQSARQSFTDWFLNELKLKYGVSAKLGQTWLQEKKLLPLLDGLDELPPSRQEPVVQAINTWLQTTEEGAPRLLVCSRMEEYELYASKLDLNGAICLNPLTDEQLQDYLASLQMEGLWEKLKHDDDLLGLVRTPLLLSVSILANDAIDLEQWEQLDTTQERLNYLLDAYIIRRLHVLINSKNKQPITRQVRHWLVWLARQLEINSQDEFSIEEMQPHLLSNRLQRIKYVSMISFIYGISVTALGCVVADPSSSILLGILSGTVAWILGYTKKQDVIQFLGGITLSGSRIARILGHLPSYLLSAFGRAIVTGILSTIYLESLFIFVVLIKSEGNIFHALNSTYFAVDSPLLLPTIYSNLIISTIVSLCMLVLVEIVSNLGKEIDVPKYPNEGFFRSLLNIIPVLFLTFVYFFVLVFLFSVNLFSELNLPFFQSFCKIFLAVLPSIILFGIFMGGGIACMKHFSLRLVLYRTNAIPWNYARFLNHCTDRLLLQRVGGRYRFIHRLVQERFAAMPLTK
ncbi:NACHT domain-containing protein [Nodosilinea nodulosa]|uniref:NACHT domain-containing protein n=1 Tax=Nodosilinea nodulosa TaxID=416001 RepID=UPI0002EF297A|nr:NACHT domain-containing protein [Nodosilinea nodulosa]